MEINLILPIVLFLIIASVVGFEMAYLQKKKLIIWTWILFGAIVLLSFILTFRNNPILSALVMTLVNSLIILVFYLIFSSKIKLKVAKK